MVKYNKCTLVEDNINNQYGKITNFAFIFDRDVILSKSNVLYKNVFLQLKKEESCYITMIEKFIKLVSSIIRLDHILPDMVC
jgi:hypothetical protein